MTQKYQLDADELGAKGESRFAEICSDAKLICNKADRDRAGWDFIVEFPLDCSESGMPLDKRSPPISCHVQVKTLLSKNNRFKMRLSSAERLAKERKPSFVYVFKVDDELKFIDAYLIHLLDANLAKVLKRLRAEEANGRPPINLKSITFAAENSGTRLDPTGAAFRNELESLCSDRNYVENKTVQVRRLGFDVRPFEISMDANFESKQEWVDFLLGLKEINATSLRAKEVRFGIPLPLPYLHADSAVVRWIPSPVTRCRLTFRGEGLVPPAAFEGEVIAPAVRELPENLRKILIKCESFQLALDNRELTIKINNEAMNSGQFSIESWINIFRLRHILSLGSACLILDTPGFASESYQIKAEVNGHGEPYLAQLVEVAEAVREIFRFAGVTPPGMQFCDFAEPERQEMILWIGRSLSRDASVPELCVTISKRDLNVLKETSVLYINFLQIGGTTIAYSAVLDMVADDHLDQVVWRTHVVEIRDIVHLRRFPQDYEGYIAEASTKNGTKDQCSIVVRPESGPPLCATLEESSSCTDADNQLVGAASETDQTGPPEHDADGELCAAAIFSAHPRREDQMRPTPTTAALSRRRLLGTGLAGAGLLAVHPARAADATPVRIGVLVDESGPFADTAGPGAVEAARMAVEDYGATVLGRRIEVLAADHQNKTDIGVGIAREWLGPGGVDLILDMGNSAIALAVQGLVRDADRVAIPVSAVTSDLDGKACSPNSIHWAANNWSNSVALMRALRAAGKTTFFFVTVDYAFGLSLEADATAEIVRSGGKVLGRVRHPLNTSDFSAYLLEAQSSGAQVVVFASAGTDVINAVQQAAEFGLTPKQSLATPAFYLSDVHAIGLQRAQGLTFMQSWYWDLDDATRAWARRFFARRGRMPNDVHAADYSAAGYFLRGVAQAGTVEGRAVIAAMRAMPIRDVFTQDGRIRGNNNKMVFTRYLMRVKAPAESHGPWDYLTLLAAIPPEQAFRPMGETGCTLGAS